MIILIGKCHRHALYKNNGRACQRCDVLKAKTQLSITALESFQLTFKLFQRKISIEQGAKSCSMDLGGFALNTAQSLINQSQVVLGTMKKRFSQYNLAQLYFIAIYR